MDNGKFIVGEYYHRCYVAIRNDVPRTFVETWIYDGIIKRDCGAAICDVPYHFYSFHRADFDIGSTARVGLSIPSLTQATATFFVWEEFLIELEHVKADYLEYVEEAKDCQRGVENE